MPFTFLKSNTTSNFNHILKTIFFGIFLTGALNTNARNFYFSSTIGNDNYSSSQAQNQSTPWRSLSKLNSFFNNLTGGDIVYFKSGDVFYGNIVANKSGDNGNPIILTSYGNGNKPLISGFQNINSWTNIGNNIYQAYVPNVSNTLNLVSINGRPQQIGRFPNSSNTSDPYLYYESAGGNSITDNQGLANNWTGASLIIRNRRWIMNKFKITSQSGGKIYYNDPNNIPASAGFGYFIVNDPRTLDQFGEWYLNTSSKNLQIHFGGNVPSNYNVKVSIVDKTIDLGTSANITVKNLSFEGANVTGLLANWSSNVSILQCNFNQMGGNGIIINGITNTLIDGVTVSNILNSGITVENTVHNVGMFAGMGENGDGGLMGIVCKVQSNAVMEYNNIDSIGYTAIDFQGNNFTIRNNFINNYCIRKDDGGAIYTYGNGVPYTNRQIYNNICLNAIGAGYGTAGKSPEAEGIYMDRGTEGVNIHDNSIAHMGRTGLLLNSIQNVQATNNTVFDGRWSIEICRFAGDQTTRNNQITNNIFYPRTADQQTLAYKNFSLNVPSTMSIQQDIAASANLDNNIYGATNLTPFSYYYSLYGGGPLIWPANISLNSWKSFSNKDWNSRNPNKIPASINDVRFEYNATQTAKTISLDANYVGVDNTNYNGSITIQPYTSKILIKNGPSIPLTTTSASTLSSAAFVPGLNCTGGNTTVTVTGSGGAAPYTGTGNFSANAGKGSLKINFPSYNTTKTSIIFANVGAISAGKNYMLSFTVLAANSSRMLKSWLRQSGGSLTPLTEPYMDQFINNGRTDFNLLFTPTISDANGRVDIEIPQSSGTTYVDNIAFFECTLDGKLISSNAFNNGLFESDILAVNVWSSNNNQIASWDNSGKISNTNYYTVTDSRGTKSTTGIIIKQPASTLTASVTQNGNTLIVTGSGGAYPYTGTGNFNANLGFNSFTIGDANGCSDETSITVYSNSTLKTNTTTTLSSNVLSAETIGGTTLKISSYPNPTTTDFSLLVQGGSTEKIGITVMGADSRTVYQTTGSSNNTYKFGNNFAAGIYIIKVLQGTTVQTLKVVKGN